MLFSLCFPSLPAARHVGEGQRVHGFGSEQGFAPRSRWVGSSCSGSGNFCSSCAESGVRDAKEGFSRPGQGGEGKEKGLMEREIKKRRSCVHVEVTLEKTEHMCLCERTRWERM